MPRLRKKVKKKQASQPPAFVEQSTKLSRSTSQQRDKQSSARSAAGVTQPNSQQNLRTFVGGSCLDNEPSLASAIGVWSDSEGWSWGQGVTPTAGRSDRRQRSLTNDQAAAATLLSTLPFSRDGAAAAGAGAGAGDAPWHRVLSAQVGNRSIVHCLSGDGVVRWCVMRQRAELAAVASVVAGSKRRRAAVRQAEAMLAASQGGPEMPAGSVVDRVYVLVSRSPLLGLHMQLLDALVDTVHEASTAAMVDGGARLATLAARVRACLTAYRQGSTSLTVHEADDSPPNRHASLPLPALAIELRQPLCPRPFTRPVDDLWSTVGPALLRLIPLATLVSLLHCALLEQRVLFVSASPALASLATTALACLLQPLVWQGALVSWLPLSHAELLDAPLPFIAGVGPWIRSSEYARDDALCFVDLDQGGFCLTVQDLPPLPQQRGLEQLLCTDAGALCAVGSRNRHSAALRQPLLSTPVEVELACRIGSNVCNYVAHLLDTVRSHARIVGEADYCEHAAFLKLEASLGQERGGGGSGGFLGMFSGTVQAGDQLAQL